MSGLVKAKKYDWKDSNLALFGSDTEKQVKKESAETEEAWRGTNPGSVGLKIWRIVKFKVTKWDPSDYGQFYNGDSYIVLNTYKPNPDSEELAYDVHFWIGRYSSQDEYGTAAYKTVELDTFLDDKAVQHRETEGHESERFKSYFPTMQMLQGGADTGFRKVKPESYEPRLLHFHGKGKNININEVARSKDSLNSDDVFILDLGLEIFQWHGKNCNKNEKFKAVQFLQTLKSERGGKPSVETIEEEDTSGDHRFYEALDQDPDSENGDEDEEFTEQLLRVRSDDSGQIEMSNVKEGVVQRQDFKSDDVFIYDTGKQVFVWTGRRASEAERKNGLSYAHNYLMSTKHPVIPISVVKEGKEGKEFHTAMAA